MSAIELKGYSPRMIQERDLIPLSFNTHSSLPRNYSVVHVMRQEAIARIRQAPPSVSKVYQLQKCHSNYSSPKVNEKDSNVFSPHTRNARPKISFSYNKKQSKDIFLRTNPGSCKQTLRERPEEMEQIKQFSLISKKLAKIQKQSRLRLCTTVYCHSYSPKPEQVTLYQEEDYPWRCDKKPSYVSFSRKDLNNISKVASTEATNSQVEDTLQASYFRNN